MAYREKSSDIIVFEKCEVYSTKKSQNCFCISLNLSQNRAIAQSKLQRTFKIELDLYYTTLLVTMLNDRNIRISDGCVYAQIRKGLGIYLFIYTNCDTVPFLLLVQYKGGLSEI